MDDHSGRNANMPPRLHFVDARTHRGSGQTPFIELCKILLLT